MQRIIITSLLILSSFIMRADDRLILTKVENEAHLYSLFENRDLTIHYYSDSFIIASIAEGKTMEQGSIVLDEKAFLDVSGYYIIYCEQTERQTYLEEAQNRGKVLFSGDDFLIMKPLDGINKLLPAKNDGMVHIPQRPAYLPDNRFDFPVITETDPLMEFLTEMVNTDSIMSYIQHLENYGTRAYDEPESYQAQDWLKSKFETWGLTTEIQTVTITPNQGWSWGHYPHSTSSGNVIAVQTGTKYPDKYIVCGAHYDSWSWYPVSNRIAPGADDNASGTAGILEIARVMSQFESEYSIVYCCFSAEEFGLWGSEAYAVSCKMQEKDILGYFNIDMSGYLKPGTPIHISLIFPSIATPLANFLKNINDIYFQISINTYANLSGGDSDHTSFNQQGYQGIWTFEDWNDCSPYIHGPNDVIGLSVNNSEQCRLFTQINFTSMATLAGVNYDTNLPIPAFSASEKTILEGNSVQFTDLSVNNPTSWKWYFEGGTPTESTEKNPTVMYKTPGRYDVKLIAINAHGSNTLLKQNYITVKMIPPIADFIADKTEIEEGESVSFTNLSQNKPDKYAWAFEGGSPLQSSLENPVVKYSKAGSYKVRLKATNDGGEHTETKEKYITVTPKTAISEKDKTSAITIYPNPTTGELKIENGELKIENVEIFDIFGCVVEIAHPPLRGGLGGLLPPGIYFVRITTDIDVIVKKIIKK